MNNIIKRVMVVGLFERGNDYLIEFDTGSNCLFGDNGTGKTTLINLIVAVLAGDIGVLTDIEFEYVEITIEKKGEFSEVSVYKSSLPTEDDTLDHSSPLLEHIEATHRQNPHVQNPFKSHNKRVDESDYSLIAYVLDGEEITFQYPTYEGRIFFFRRIMKSRKHLGLLKRLSSLINLTHVPLLRVKSNEWDSMDEPDLTRYKKWDSKTESSRFDASTVVLKEIEDAFKCMAVALTQEDNKKLESFKSQIVQKFLIGKEIHSTFPKLAEESKRDSYIVEDLFEQLKYAGLEVPKEKLEENFETLAKLDDETRLAVEHVEKLKSKTNLTSGKNIQKAEGKVSQSFIKLIVARTLFERFETIVDDVESLQDDRNSLWDLFHDYERIVNKFLNNKYFCINKNGTFEVRSGSRIVDLKNLSSGEKHIICLLGRAALSRSNGAVFIADEPELSLHLTWQRMMLPSILELSPKSQIIVATHSPSIISRKSNKIDLGAL